MPNTGRPSLDCHLCRSRRVKCDLGRPGCQRCVKYGVDCPGYREQHELVFRNANPLNIKKRKKRAAAQENEDGSSKSTPTSTISSRSASPRSGNDGGTVVVFDARANLAVSPSASCASDSPAPSIARSLTEHWTEHSVPIILNVYSTLDFLHNIYRINARNGPLVWAAHLFSRTYVTNIRYPIAIHKESESETQRELAIYLGKTLSAVNSALQEPDGPFRDDVLATVWILANYELLVGSLGRMEALSPWHLHTKGLYSILKTRGKDSFISPEGRTAFWPCYNMVQIQALVGNIECPPESDEWLEAIKEHIFEGEEYTLKVAIFINKCAHILSTIMNILSRRDFAAAEMQYDSLIGQLAAADDEIENFCKSDAEGDHEMDVYMRNLYSSAIIKSHNFIVLLSNFLTHHASSRISLEQLRTKRHQGLRRIRGAAQSILDSVPFGLGPLASGKDKSPRVLFDALKMVWPLICVYVISGTLPEQKSEAEVALVFIGKEIGVRQALNSYPGTLPIPREAREPLGFVRDDDVLTVPVD